jgi:hypothetical protein
LTEYHASGRKKHIIGNFKLNAMSVKHNPAGPDRDMYLCKGNAIKYGSFILEVDNAA